MHDSDRMSAVPAGSASELQWSDVRQAALRSMIGGFDGYGSHAFGLLLVGFAGLAVSGGGVLIAGLSWAAGGAAGASAAAIGGAVWRRRRQQLLRDASMAGLG